jgi:phosphatidylinositol alpha-1,6-mannosyltransferase
MLLKALPEIATKVPDVALLIVGDGPFRKELKKLTNELQLRNRVHFTGKVAPNELSRWYAAGDVFAMPCRTRMGGWDVEGLGIVFLEGSATGLPVVVGDSGGAVDAVVDGETGFLVNGNDLRQITDRIVELLLNPQLASQMGAAGRDWVKQQWTWDLSFKRLDALLSGIDPH